MRSYEAARKSYNFLEFFARVVIGAGVLVAIFSMMTVSTYGAVAALGFAPALLLIAFGSFNLAYIQTSRAAVDSAEYAQQSLKLARDQMDISKQMLKLAQATPSPVTYEAEPQSNELTDISFDTDEEKPTAQNDKSAEERAVAYPPQVHQHAGREITVKNGRFFIPEGSYDTLEEAQLAIDRILRVSNSVKIGAK